MTSSTGASQPALPSWSAVGSTPIRVDAPPISAMVTISIHLRPILSPSEPKIRPPIGRATKPTPNQLICAANISAIAEASVVAERAGLDVGQLLELLQGGYAGSTILADKGPRFAAKDYSVSGAAYLWIKDLKAYLDEARRTGVATLQGDRLLDAFDDLTAQGLGDQDTAVIQKWLAERPTT